MALDTEISNAAAIAACNSIVDLLDVGGAGTLRIYGGGAGKPAGVDVAVTDQTILAELVLSATAFGNAADGNPGGTATAATITDDSSANASGTANWFRAFSGGGTGVIDGTVGATGGGFDMELNSVAISAGAQVSITSWTFTVPEGA